MLKYRPDIDGLRAIAVISVILFHAGLHVFQGGFVGVDVFFVISGYLITNIILSEMKQGNFSLGHFYERRIKRILPALFFVVLLSSCVSWYVLPPKEFMDFGESVSAVGLFSSNILFWQKSGYFDTAAELKPLLHTWSLAVEEQFYIGFPLLLVVISRYAKSFLPYILGILFFVSLGLSYWGSHHATVATFYLLPTRAWELILGAGIAAYDTRDNPHSEYSHIQRQFLSGLGLLFILLSVFLFNETTPFPSFYALLPTVGAALIIIFSSHGTYVYSLLSNRIAVGIGLISYSLYLWHQPLFALTRHYTLLDFSNTNVMALVLLLFPASFLSWKFIEKPFRSKNFLGRRLVFSLAFFCSSLMVCWGTYINYRDGLYGRFDDVVANIYKSMEDRSSLKDIAGNPDNLSMALIGDSHANMLIDSLDTALGEMGMGMRVLTKAGCPPITNIFRHDIPDSADECHKHNKKVYQDIISDPKIEYVIILARYPLYLEFSRFDNQEGGKELGGTDKVIFDSIEYPNIVRNDQERFTFLREQFLTDFSRLHSAGKKLILVYPIPEVGWDTPKYLANLIIQKNFHDDVSTSLEAYLKRSHSSYDVLDGFASSHDRVYRILPQDVFCDKKRCYGSIDQHPLYLDSNHINNFGARILVNHLVKTIAMPSKANINVRNKID